MSNTRSEDSIRGNVTLAAVGLAVGGAAMAVPFGVGPMLRHSLLLPGQVFGVFLLMVPALYISAAFIGTAPAPTDVLRSVSSGMRAIGVLMMGLSPALAFLLATNTDASVFRALTLATTAGAAGIGFAVLHSELFRNCERRSLATASFIVWACVTVAIGGRVLLSNLPN